jgi:NDP-sugar pyrophosphorylase family protein
MSFNNSVILSGGFGTRMRPITDYIPKALVEVDGNPLISYVFKLIDGENNMSDIKKYVTYGHKSEILFNATKGKVDGYINTTGKDNSYFLYNSFIKHINEPIIVTPCDMIMDIDLDEVYRDYIELGSPSIMVVGVTPVKGVDGDFIEYDEANRIVSLSRENITNKYCSGLQIINPYKVNDITKESNNFYDVWEQLKHMGELKVSNVVPTEWKCYDNLNEII